MPKMFTHVEDVPLALGVFLASDSYDYNSDPHTISATTLMKPIRQIILPGRVPAGMGLPVLADMMNNRMGAAIHDGIERAWKDNYDRAMFAMGYPSSVVDRIRINPTDQLLKSEPDIIPIYLEQRLTRRFGKWNISGKFDFVGEGRVQDFKSTSVWTYKNQVNNDKYALQGSIYRWLDPKLITQDQMDIHYIFTDWKQTMSRVDPNYPKKRFHTQSFNLLSMPETESFIRQKTIQIEQFFDAKEEDIPLCSDEDLWRSEPQFKYYKDPTKVGRSTKNFETRQEAIIRLQADGNVGMVKEVPGQVTACKYCPAFAVCSQKDQLIASGELILF